MYRNLYLLFASRTSSMKKVIALAMPEATCCLHYKVVIPECL